MSRSLNHFGKISLEHNFNNYKVVQKKEKVFVKRLVTSYLSINQASQIMRHLNSFSLVKYFSSNKVYYPALLSPNYDNIDFEQFYYRTAADLKVDNKNKFQILDSTLPKFLEKQLQDDKKLFLKQKEFLFLGRSNVGKSSLINAIFNDDKIARRSKHPGTTKFLHFHQIHSQNAFVVDAPGYGFANMNKRRRHLWFGLTEEYMKISSRLAQIFLLVNFEHGLKQIDKEFISRADKYNIRIQVVMTKVDKVKEEKYFSQFRAINEQIRRMDVKNVDDMVLAVSTKTKFGLSHLKCRMVQAIEHSAPRMTDMHEDLLLSYVRQMRVQPTDIKEKQHQLSKQHIVRKLIYESKLTKYLVK